MTTSLYIHIPLCKNKCPYCDFYSIKYNYLLAKEYVSILSKQIEKINTPISTVYIGGGTPTVIDLDLWERLFSSLRAILKNSCENTIEANPDEAKELEIDLI